MTGRHLVDRITGTTCGVRGPVTAIDEREPVGVCTECAAIAVSRIAARSAHRVTDPIDRGRAGEVIRRARRRGSDVVNLYDDAAIRLSLGHEPAAREILLAARRQLVALLAETDALVASLEGG